MELPRLFKTASFRLTAFYGTLLVASFVVLLSVSYLTLTAALRDQMKTKIDEDFRSLSEEWIGDGDNSIIQDVHDKLKSSGNAGGFYFFVDSHGTKLAGNLDGISLKEGWQELPFAGVLSMPANNLNDRDHQLWGEGRRLPDGGFLFVGQDAFRVLAAQETILNSFLMSAGMALAIAAIAGMYFSNGFLRRIDSINEASQKIMDGNLRQRIAVHGTSDEIDRVSLNLNRLFNNNEKLLESLKHMGASIAHDLRSPLARLRQGLEETRLTSVTAKHYKDAVDRAIGDTDQILSIFSALIRIAQIESGSRRSGFVNCDLSGLVEKVAHTYIAVAEDEGKALSLDVARDISFHGDAHLLLQLFANLIENAIRHTPIGTQITVKLGRDGTQIKLVIADNGNGIPAELRRRVFERFFRLDASRSTPGSGLGLALVAAVAELHGVEVRLDDNYPGVKATLHFA